MQGVNKVFLIGNLTKDPELKYTDAGQAICNLNLACNESYTNSAREKKETVVFVPVTVFGKSGENAAKYLAKGSPVFIEGKLRQESWETEKGEKRKKMSVTALSVQFLGRPASTGTGEAREEQQHSAAAPPITPGGPEDDDVPF